MELLFRRALGSRSMPREEFRQQEWDHQEIIRHWFHLLEHLIPAETLLPLRAPPTRALVIGACGGIGGVSQRLHLAMEPPPLTAQMSCRP